MKRRYGVFFAAFVFLVFFFSMEARAVDWVLYTTSPDGCCYYYDPQSIRRVSEDIVRVWEKIVYSEKYIKKLGPKYFELSFDISLVEYNCSEKKYRLLSLSEYSKNEGIIEGLTTYDSHSWDFIVPGSVVEPLFNIICKPRHNLNLWTVIIILIVVLIAILLFLSQRRRLFFNIVCGGR